MHRHFPFDMNIISNVHFIRTFKFNTYMQHTRTAVCLCIYKQVCTLETTLEAQTSFSAHDLRTSQLHWRIRTCAFQGLQNVQGPLVRLFRSISAAALIFFPAAHWSALSVSPVWNVEKPREMWPHPPGSCTRRLNRHAKAQP